MVENQTYTRSRVGQIRVVVAWVCAMAATVYAAAGCIDPAWVGFGQRHQVFYLTALPLAAAALVHVYLVSMGTRCPADDGLRAASACERTRKA